MAGKASQEAVSREQQRFFVGTTEIPGVQSVRADYTNNAALVKYLAFTKYNHVPRGSQLGNITVSNLLVTDDIFYNLTGTTGFNGYIVNKAGSPSVCYRSGYLTSYSSRYAYGSLPQVDVGIAVMGNIGNFSDQTTINELNAISNAYSDLLLKVPGPGCMTLNVDEFTSNRVISYDLSVQCPRNPVYSIGSMYPSAVNSITPLEVSISFQVEINDYKMKNFRVYPFNQNVQNITLTLKSFDQDAVVANYSFDNMFMLGEAYETSINGNAAVAVQYKGFI